ncbi:MAG: hypothetical protein LC115_06235 [Bacteroidia bacterium]|nr:hypothetical protein [Bacteroidia bacterium]
MKRTYLALAIVLAIGSHSCKSFKGATVTVTPNPLEVHADSVKFSVKANIPAKSGIKKGGIYTGELVIKNGANTFTLNKINVPYEKYPNIKKEGASLSTSGETAFNDKMDGGNLIAVNKYSRKKKNVDLPDLTLAPCCITTSRLVYENDQFLMTKHSYVKEVPLTLTAVFQFPRDVFAIQPTEFDKSEIRNIGDFISKRFPATSITVVGFASPEGPFKRNQMLSVNRSKEVVKWLTDQLKNYGYSAYLDSTFFKISTTSEDWDGFKANLRSMPFSEDVKSQIIEIASAGYDEDLKEKKIMALVGGYKNVEEILAPLRRATIRLEGYEPRRTDAQIDSISAIFANGGNKGTLREIFQKEEWLYAASRITNNTARRDMLKEFTQAYKEEYRAFNDLGVLYLKERNTEEGFNALSEANRLSANNYIVQNNLGVAYKNKKNIAEAKKLYENSLSGTSTPEAQFNYGVILEKKAMYSAATERFGNSRSLGGALYNSGLCKLLMGDFAGAKTDLETAIREDQTQALYYYVLAIVGVRTGASDIMAVNLKKAATLDSKFGTKARNDLEFRKQWESAEFKAAVGN